MDETCKLSYSKMLQLESERDTACADNDRLKQNKRALKLEVDRLKQELATAQRERDAARVELDAMTRFYKDAERDGDTARAELAVLRQWRDYVLSALRGLKRWKIDWKGQRVLADERGMWTGYAALQALLAPSAPKQDARQPAEVFPVSEYIQDEMKERNWTRLDLARESGLDIEVIHNIIDVNNPITSIISVGLHMAFGTGPDVWLNLDRVWRERQ